MTPSWKRACLVVLIAVSVATGAWAYFAPKSWYDGFPGAGLSWLPRLGPYNGHFARDVGALSLATGLLSVIAFVRVREDFWVRVTGAVWLVFHGLHLVYHLTMLGLYGMTDRVLSVVSLCVPLIASALLVLPARLPAPRGAADGGGGLVEAAVPRDVVGGTGNEGS